MMKSLLRKYWYLTVVALLCCVPMAFGQTSMTLQSTVTSNPSEAGIYTGAYPFTLTTSNGTSNIAGVCDDFADEIYIGEQWTVNVNTFASIGNTSAGSPMWGLLTGTGYTPTQLYLQAAWLVEQMNANAGNSAVVSAISYAIWQVFDPPGSSDTSFQWLTAYDPSALGAAQSWLTQAEMASNYNSVNTSNFEILTATDTNPNNPTSNAGAGSVTSCPSGGCGQPQEFIVEIQTPETSAVILFGADMLGLLGLAIVFRRRLLRPLI